MSINQYLTDVSTRHQVFIQRYAGGESKKAVNTLSRLRRDINARLANEPTQFQQSRLRAILEDIDKLTASAFGKVAIDLKGSTNNLAIDEAEFSAGLYNKVVQTEFTLPPEVAVLNAVEVTPMRIGAVAITIDDALKQFSEKKAIQIRQAILDGVALGDTTPEISRKVTGMVNTLHRRQVDALTRTVINHASSVGRGALFEQNKELLDGYKWISTLDSRTTLICGGRDGQVYEIGLGPMPPAHYGCRSTTIPKVKGEFTLAKRFTGKRASKGAAGGKEVSANSTYGDWLKKQPKEFIDEALGVERSKLFRSGKYKISEFTDPTGRVYTLDELRGMDSITLQEF